MTINELSNASQPAASAEKSIGADTSAKKEMRNLLGRKAAPHGDDTVAAILVQITHKIAEKHSNEDELLREVENALSTGQQIQSLMRIESLVVLTCMQEQMSALLPYWLQASKWAFKGTNVPPSILNSESEHLLFEMLQETPSNKFGILSSIGTPTDMQTS